MTENTLYECELTKGSFEEVKDRLGNIDDIDALDSCGSTWLLAACSNRQVQFVEYFIGLRANVDFLDDCGDTPILAAIDNCVKDEDSSIKIVSLLLDAGADIELRGYMDKTPFLKACSRNSIKMIRFLVGHGCDVHAKVTEYGKEYGALHFVGVFTLNRKLRNYVKELCNS